MAGPKKRRLAKRLGAAMFLTGFLTIEAGLVATNAQAAAPNPRTFPNDEAQINSGNVPADSSTYNSDTDCGTLTGTQVGWLFVLPNGPANGATSFDSLDVKFQNAGTITN